MIEQKKFIIHENTKIGFGKLKGRPHGDFLLKENERYKTWIINQGEEFRYADTRQWILDNEAVQPLSFKITSNTNEEKFHDICLKVQELLDSNEYKGLTIHSVFG